MEKFKKKIRNNIMLGVFFLLLNIVLTFLKKIYFPDVENGLENSFVCGLLGGVTFVLIFDVLKNIALFRNEEKLKKRYIIETDERTVAVEAAAGKAGLKIVLLGLATALIVASFVDKCVATTLLVALVFTVIVIASTKFYYNKKM